MVLLRWRGDLHLIHPVQEDHCHADRHPSHLDKDSVNSSSQYFTLYTSLYSSHSRRCHHRSRLKPLLQTRSYQLFTWQPTGTTVRKLFSEVFSHILSPSAVDLAHHWTSHPHQHSPMVNFCPSTGSLRWLAHCFKRTLIGTCCRSKPLSPPILGHDDSLQAESQEWSAWYSGTWVTRHVAPHDEPRLSKTIAHKYSCPDVCVVSFSDDSSVLGLLPNLSCLTTCCSCLLHDVSAPVRSAREQCNVVLHASSRKNFQDTKRGTTRTHPISSRASHTFQARLLLGAAACGSRLVSLWRRRGKI